MNFPSHEKIVRGSVLLILGVPPKEYRFVLAVRPIMRVWETP